MLLLKEQLNQPGIVGGPSTTLQRPSSLVAGDARASLTLPTSADVSIAAGGPGTTLHPTAAVDFGRLADEAEFSPLENPTAVWPNREGGSRPPLQHSASLPPGYGQHGTSSVDSSLAAELMQRMFSLESRVAEQQRRSEADMARLLNQVCS